MRRVLWLVTASIGCAASRPPPPQTAPIEDETAASNSEDARRDEEETASDAAAAELDFSEDVAAPSATVSAPPERRPSGAFELCGDKCRDDTELKKSFDDVDDE